MKLQDEIKHIKTDVNSLKSFAWIVGGIFTVLGLLSAHKHGHWVNPFSLIGVTLLISGTFAPIILKPVYIGWMALGFVMGMVVSPIMFSLLFFLAVTPISLLARMFGKKFLDFEFRSDKKTYWVTKVKKQSLEKHAENQF